jgi:lysophospholipase L1-like esterase
MCHSLILASCLAALAQPPARFELKDGDRIVLLGGGLIEQEQFHGFLETRLLRHTPGKKVTFRNLGWSGDTVRGSARSSGYQNPEGLARLLREVKEVRPTVLFLGYGMNESFAGPAGLEDFIHGYQKLLDEIAPLKARLVILSPTPHEDLGRPFPKPGEHNRHLAQYNEALRELARARGAYFVDLFWQWPDRALTGEQTSNGILLNEVGYRILADAVEGQLGLPRTAAQALERDAAVNLRRAIVQRNELFYRRWRPFNDHSRHWGFMAKDFLLYDEEIAAQERVIERLRVTNNEDKR